VPKRRHIKFRRPEITQKKAYNIIQAVNVDVLYKEGYTGWLYRQDIYKAGYTDRLYRHAIQA
jgi:hypothetical protein